MRHFEQERGIPIQKISFLPNGADTERLHPMAADDAFAKRMGVVGRKVFTYAGTMAPYQGLEVIVQAAKRLKHRGDIVFLMVGKGPERDGLIQQAFAHGLENVIFRESPFEEMLQLMSISYASLVVLRPLGIARKMRLSKAIPPLACGVPVIYAGWGETAEIVERESVGVKVEPGRADLLSGAIAGLADDRKTRDAMGVRGRALAEKEFSWSFIVGDWVRQVRAIGAHQDPGVLGPE